MINTYGKDSCWIVTLVVLTEADGRPSHGGLGASGVPFYAWGHSEFTDTVEWFRHPVPVEVVAPEAVEMPSQVWAGASDQICVDCISLPDQPFQGFAHRHDIVKDQEICDEVIVFDELALLIATHWRN
jgi:hypothetical protein